MNTLTVSIEIGEDDFKLLEALTRGKWPAAETVAGVIEHLARHAADGVRRPGAWERDWLIQCVGPEFVDELEQDPEVEWHQRPRRVPA
jgi:hypothetical protein